MRLYWMISKSTNQRTRKAMREFMVQVSCTTFPKKLLKESSRRWSGITIGSNGIQMIPTYTKRTRIVKWISRSNFWHGSNGMKRSKTNGTWMMN